MTLRRFLREPVSAGLIIVFIASLCALAWVTYERARFSASYPPPLASSAPVWSPAAPSPEVQALESDRRRSIEMRARLTAECEMREGCAAYTLFGKPVVRCTCPIWERAYE